MKDELARDKAIDQVLAEKLRGAPSPAGACPDADIIAAYFERTLAPKERITWEAHFDGCVRCQARIAALVRMDQADEASLSVPKARSVAQPRKTFNLRWAWAAPLLLAVVVGGLWYTGELAPLLHQTPATGERAEAPKTEKSREAAPTKLEAPSASEKAKAPSSTTPPVVGQAPAHDKMSASPSSPAPSVVQAQPRVQALDTFVGSASHADNQNQPPAPSTAEAKAAPEKAEAEGAIAPPAERARLESAQGSATSAATSGASPGVSPAPVPAGEAGTKEAPSAAEPSAASVSRKASVALGGLEVQNGLLMAKRSAETRAAADAAADSGVHYAIVSAAPDKDEKTSTPELWLVGPHGLIQKQNQDGLWESKPSGVAANLSDVSFPSPEVGWAVGQGGVIIRSEQGGERWGRVSSPTSEDLLRVTAKSAETAAVTTRSGEVYSTTDGGKSWTRAVP